MKHRKLIQLITLALATGSLVACSGGGGSSDSDTVTADTASTTVGTITGFGSIFVNGVEFETEGATCEVDDTSPFKVNYYTQQKCVIG